MHGSVQIELAHSGCQATENYHHVYGTVETSNGYNGRSFVCAGAQHIHIGKMTGEFVGRNFSTELNYISFHADHVSRLPLDDFDQKSLSGMSGNRLTGNILNGGKTGNVFHDILSH